MKVFLKNGLAKKLLIVFITIVMISNFIMPNYAFAATQSAGEKLVSGFFYLIAYIGDIAIEFMQEAMLGNGKIYNGEKYQIAYSPGMIFANEVPALDINFINPMDKKEKITGNTIKYVQISDISTGEMKTVFDSLKTKRIKSDGFYNINHFANSLENEYDEIVRNYDYKNRDYHGSVYDTNMDYDDWYGNGWFSEGLNFVFGNLYKSNEYWISGNTMYFMVFYYQDMIVNYSVAYSIFSTELTNTELQYFKDNAITPTTPNSSDDEKYNESVAQKLQSNIATWYVALRTIALVGLLSVLVYIGIRIILSSASAQDKAKYKNMLKDWLVAICILFVLHYIMAFTLQLTGSLNNIIKDKVVNNNSDELMSSIRNSFSDEFDDVWTEAPGYVIMYLALVILTGIFTVQYLKRVVFMAFLTMIAPMIALTYPLDKIKDGKAQAFSYWMREYIFNCLIQPVHLLLYTILITNAMDFVKTNVLYAIVALAFMVPAEKFIKEMFGMKSSSPTGQLGAAAGGAVVMSMINKMRGIKPPKDAPDGNGGGAPNGIRTPNSTRTANVNNSTNNNNQNNNNNNNNNQNYNNQNNNNQNNNNNNQNNNNNNNNQNSNRNQNNSSNTSISGSTSWRRWKSIRGVNSLASAGGRLSRVTGGILGGVAAGTVGLAAQVADGDLFDNPTKAFTDAATAVGVGAVAGNNLVGQGVRLERNIREWGEKKALGIDEYNNMQFDGKFYKSDAYKSIEQDAKVDAMCKAAGIKTKNAVQSFLDSGVTDASKIKEALQNGIGGVTYKAYSDSGVSDVDKMSKMSNAGITPQIYKEQYKDKGIDDVSKILKLKKKYPNLSDDGIANRMAIAKDAPKSQQQFIPWAKAKFRNLDDAGAEALYKTIVDFF